jgi:hypothetical protein
MNRPRLSISADSAQEFLERLAAVDITVPLVTEESRTKAHREQYMVARLIATLARDAELAYPLQLLHREKPDFLLEQQKKRVGIECVEAVSSEWAHINHIRETEFPDALIMLPMLKPGATSFTREERIEIAKGGRSGPPWVGKMAERQWAEAIVHFIEGKVKKLRAGNYVEYPQNWLLIHDEWRVPMYSPTHKREAAKLCLDQIQSIAQDGQFFERIYVSSGEWLIKMWPAPLIMAPINNLWE